MAKRQSDIEIKLRAIVEALLPDVDIDDEMGYASIDSEGNVRYRPAAPAQARPVEDDEDEDDEFDDEDDDDFDDDEGDEEPERPRAREPKRKAPVPEPARRNKTAPRREGRGKRPRVKDEHNPEHKDYDPMSDMEAWVSDLYGE